MKRLQEIEEFRWEFTSKALLDGVRRPVENPRQVILLLHGLNERGRRIYRKLLSALPSDALVLAPNGPFPLPRYKEAEIQYGFTWYFYDRFKKDYFISMDYPIAWLKDLLLLENPLKLPVTIIGFSQGGYLAPVLGLEIPETKKVIGIGCEFRSVLIKGTPTFHLIDLHGEKDDIVKLEWAQAQNAELKARGISVDLRLVPETGHEITGLMSQAVKENLEN